MEVLVGIVSKNRATLLVKAIESALMQTGVNVTVAVFDDNSSDETSLLKEKYPQVSWEFSKKNRGYLYARNKMMRETKATYFCSLDDDAWFIDKQALSKAVHQLEDRSEVAAIAFDIITLDNSSIFDEQVPYETNMFIGCGHVLKLRSVRDVGYYEPNPSFYGGEEKDLCIRLMDKEYQILFLPGIYVWHEKTNLARNSKLQHQSGVCNDLVFTYRRTPGIYLLFALTIKILKHLWFSFRFKDESIMKAGLFGVLDFMRLLVLFKLSRKPVRTKTFIKFMELNSAITK